METDRQTGRKDGNRQKKTKDKNKGSVKEWKPRLKNQTTTTNKTTATEAGQKHCIIQKELFMSVSGPRRGGIDFQYHLIHPVDTLLQAGGPRSKFPLFIMQFDSYIDTR